MRWVMVALRQMYDFSRPQGESCYRLMNASGQFIYLKTRGFLEIDEKTNRVHSFVCVNTLVTEEEGKRLITEMKRHFSVIIDQNEVLAVTKNGSDAAETENPQQLESAIMTLITNLGPSTNLDYNIPSVESDSSVESECSSRSKSATPLSIIAPQYNTIKSTVFKSAGVLATATNKKFKSAKSSNNKSESTAAPATTITERPSVLKMHGNFTPQTTSFAMYQETRIKYEPQSPSSGGRFSSEYLPQNNLSQRDDLRAIESNNELYQKAQNNNITAGSHHQYEMAQQSTSRSNYKRSYNDAEVEFMSKRRNVEGCEEVEPCIKVLEDPNTGECTAKYYKMSLKNPLFERNLYEQDS